MRTREDEWAPSLGARATPTRSGMRAVGSFVPGLTAKAFAKHGFTAAGLAAQWSAIVGPELAAYTLPEKLRWPPRPAAGGAAGERRQGATLVLRVEGARALELQFQAPQLRERVNGYFGYPAIAAMRFLQGPIAQPVAIPTRAASLGAIGPAGADGRSADPAVLPQLAAIADPALRNALCRLQAGVRRGGP